MTTTERKWKYEIHSASLADTGDYTSCITFTNGIDILQTGRDEIEDEQCQQFCDLLNLMPDLWSHKLDAAEFELAQLKKESIASVIGKEMHTIRERPDKLILDKADELYGKSPSLKECHAFREGCKWMYKYLLTEPLSDLTPKTDTTDGE